MSDFETFTCCSGDEEDEGMTVRISYDGDIGRATGLYPRGGPSTWLTVGDTARLVRLLMRAPGVAEELAKPQPLTEQPAPGTRVWTLPSSASPSVYRGVVVGPHPNETGGVIYLRPKGSGGLCGWDTFEHLTTAVPAQ